MKIAIIDSGINREMFLEQIDGGISFYMDKDYNIRITDDYTDEHGHGTKVLKTLQKENNENQYYIVKILNENNETSSQLLIEALKHLLEIDVKCILLCLATENRNYKCEMQLIADQLIEQGKIIISSLKNGIKSSDSYPASLQGVIGVRGSLLIDDLFFYSKGKKIQCTSNSETLYMRGIGPKFCSFSGNSKACAVFTRLATKEILNSENIIELEIKLTDNQTSDFNHFLKKYAYDLKKQDSDEEYEVTNSNENMKLEQMLRYSIDKDINNKYGDNIKNIPFWLLFKSVDAISDYLNNTCILYNINPEELVLKRSDLQSLEKYCQSLLKQKNYMQENLKT